MVVSLKGVGRLLLLLLLARRSGRRDVQGLACCSKTTSRRLEAGRVLKFRGKAHCDLHTTSSFISLDIEAKESTHCRCYFFPKRRITSRSVHERVIRTFH